MAQDMVFSSNLAEAAAAAGIGVNDDSPLR
jgi:hypothetical protein